MSKKKAIVTVKDFLDCFRQYSEQIANEPWRFPDFLKHKRRGDKSVREEQVPIVAYLRRKLIPLDGVVELGGEAHDFDAKLSYAVEGRRVKYTIEVVQALAEGAHKFRLAMAAGKMNDAMRAEERQQFTTFPQPIIDAIKAKQDRFYSDTRILLVALAGEVTQENDRVIDQWLNEVRSNTIKGAFSEIFLVETARYLIFQIH